MDVLRVATEAAALVHRLTQHLSVKDKDQAVRSGNSGALNTAEGLGYTGARERNHIQMAYASCQEAKTAVHLLAVAGKVDLELARETYRALDRAAAMLYGVLRK